MVRSAGREPGPVVLVARKETYMALTQQEIQAAVNRLKKYPKGIGDYWGQGQLKKEHSREVAELLANNPKLKRYG